MEGFLSCFGKAKPWIFFHSVPGEDRAADPGTAMSWRILGVCGLPKSNEGDKFFPLSHPGPKFLFLHGCSKLFDSEHKSCLLNYETFYGFALTQLQLQLLPVFMVCLQFFTDKEPECTLLMIYKYSLIPLMFRSSLRNIPVPGYVNVYFYPCSATFSQPQDWKCERTRDDLTCHKMSNKMSVCLISLPDN